MLLRKSEGNTEKKWTSILLLVIGLLPILMLVAGITWIYKKFKYRKDTINWIADEYIDEFTTLTPATHILDEWEQNIRKEEQYTMGILKRIRNIVMADIHGTLDKLESPINMLKQYIRETEAQMVKAQHALSQQLYLEKKYAALIAETEALAAKRARQAELAVSRNEDNIAQLALQEKVKNKNKATLYREQYKATKKQTAALYEQINKLQGSIRSCNIKISFLFPD